jgi:serine/threonine-protein kinase HipA
MDKINEIEVFCNRSKVGRLAQTEQGFCAFEYDTEFLKTGFTISPYYLPLHSGVFIAKGTPFHGGLAFLTTVCPMAGVAWYSTAIFVQKA